MGIVECKDCSECMLRRDGICPVPGEGNLDANVMFVGRDPGETENKLGRPFVGASGKFLRDEINYYLSDDDYYITNLVKCHTFGNIGPTEEQILSCFKHLQNEIIEIVPPVIVALGKTVADYLVSNPYYIDCVDITKETMESINGREFEIDVLGRKFIVIPTYHPSPRNYCKYDSIRNVIKSVSQNYGTKNGYEEKTIDGNEENENSME